MPVTYYAEKRIFRPDSATASYACELVPLIIYNTCTSVPDWMILASAFGYEPGHPRAFV